MQASLACSSQDSAAESALLCANTASLLAASLLVLL